MQYYKIVRQTLQTTSILNEVKRYKKMYKVKAGVKGFGSVSTNRYNFHRAIPNNIQRWRSWRIGIPSTDSIRRATSSPNLNLVFSSYKMQALAYDH